MNTLSRPDQTSGGWDPLSLHGVRLLALTGPAGAGKDTAADSLGEGWLKTAFAEPLKRICVEFLGLSEEDVSTQEGKARFNPLWGMTNRAVLQRVGTDAFRNGFDRDVWVKVARIRISGMLAMEGEGAAAGPSRVVATDCRFDNEARLVEELGGVCVRITRGEGAGGGVVLGSSDAAHASEQGVSDWLVAGTVVNDSTVEDLGRRLRDLLDLLSSRHPAMIRELDRLVRNSRVDPRSARRLALLLRKHHAGHDGSVFFEEGEGAARAEWLDKSGSVVSAVSVGPTGTTVSCRRSDPSGRILEDHSFDENSPGDFRPFREFMDGIS